jgi:hypothetical protein
MSLNLALIIIIYIEFSIDYLYYNILSYYLIRSSRLL